VGEVNVETDDDDEAEDFVRPETIPLSDPDFKDQLAQVIPHLRAFGRSLSGSRDLADDLVQETLLKAWAARKRFQAGTNMRAWTFIILRNLFLSQMRRARFKGGRGRLRLRRSSRDLRLRGWHDQEPRCAWPGRA
jgi:RNA polymerase sigma-70 factor (ECF subfamily)